jgi:hypothetical protein
MSVAQAKLSSPAWKSVSPLWIETCRPNRESSSRWSSDKAEQAARSRTGQLSQASGFAAIGSALAASDRNSIDGALLLFRRQ